MKNRFANSKNRRGILSNIQGFTLIELLAVIVILGLLAVLIIPKVTETIKNSRMNINKASASGLVRVAEKYFVEKNSSLTSFQGCTYDFTTNTNTCDGLEFTGEKPESGKLYIGKDGVIEFAVKFDKFCYIKNYNENDVVSNDYDQSTCVYSKHVGDEYTIAGESFLVIDSNSEETTLIAKYNLYVGGIYNSSATKISDITSSDNGYGKQNLVARGYINSTDDRIGTLAFSNTNYWDSGVGSTYLGSYSDSNYPYVYDSNSILYNIVNDYKTLLNNSNVNVKSARLMSYQEAIVLGCTTTANSCPSWIGNSTFRLGSANSSNYVWTVLSSSDRLSYGIYSNQSYDGVRPVIVVNTSDI